MKKELVFIPITILLLVLVSGCTGFPNLFGGDVINIQNVVTREKTTDVMIIKDILTIPHSPMLPDQAVVLSFIIENKDDLKTLENVKVDLYNAPLFKNREGELCNLYAQDKQKPCLPEAGDITGTPECIENNPCRLLAGEERMIQYSLMTPSEKEIVNIKTQEKLDFKVNYNFDGSMLYTVPVVNMDEIINRQRQGEKTTVQISKAHGSGPVQIDVELFGSNYILSGYSAIFLFKVKNNGAGVLKGQNQIEARMLVIEFPAELVNARLIEPGDYKYNFIYEIPYEYPNTPTGFATGSTLLPTQLPQARDLSDVWEDVAPQDESKKQFDCTYIIEDLKNIIRCTNLKPLPLYKDETRTSLRFEIPKVVKLADTPFKSYDIRAFVKYTYELRNSVDVTINPYGNV